MMREWLADYSALFHRCYLPLFDSVYVPLRFVVGSAAAYWLADVLLEALRWLLLEPLAFWLAEDVIRARWASDDSAL